MEKQSIDRCTVEVFKKNDTWCAHIGDNPEAGYVGYGKSMSDALKGLANDIDQKAGGMLVANKASDDGRGTLQDKQFIQQSLDPSFHET